MIIPDVVSPFGFNPLKHHWGAMGAFVASCSPVSIYRADFMGEIVRIGDSVTDIYMGDLTVDLILRELSGLLFTKGDFVPEIFFQWIGRSPKGYRRVSLSDGSEWLIRKGAHALRPIHLHPAKESKSTIRLRGCTLQTLLVVMVAVKQKDHRMVNLEQINQVRRNILHLSPMKSLDKRVGLGKAIMLARQFWA